MEFIGREEYLQEFNNYIDQTMMNERIVFNIYGLTGIGKSALLQEFKKKGKDREVDVVEIDFKFIKTMEDLYNQIDRELDNQEIKTRYFDLAYLIYFQKKNPKIKIQDKLPEWLEDSEYASELIDGMGGAVAGPAKVIFKFINKFINKFTLEKSILADIAILEEKSTVEIEEKLIEFFRYDLKLLSKEEKNNGIIFLMDSYDNIESLLEERLSVLIEKLNNTKSLFIITTKESLDWEKNFIQSKEVRSLSNLESEKILMASGINESELINKLVNECEGIGSQLTLVIKKYKNLTKYDSTTKYLKIKNALYEKKKVDNAKIINSSISTNRPNYIDRQYSDDIFRVNTYNELFVVLKSKEEPNSLSIVHGSPGIGKSSFMATSFNKLSTEEFNKIVYFIEDANDDLKEIDNIYSLIENNILIEFKEKNIDFDNNIIYGDSDILTKLEYLFHTYSQKVYLGYGKAFILMVDGLDILLDNKNFVSKLVKNHEGIHFVFSTRNNFENNFFISLKNKNKNLNIYNNQGIVLTNLNEDSTSLYFDKVQKLDKVLDKEKVNYIKKNIYLKSKGLPKYFNLLIKKLNHLSIVDEENIYEKLNEYIQKLPEELEEFYIEEFQNIKKNSKLSLEILTVLYWYSQPIEKKMLKGFITEENVQLIDIAINEISHLVSINENKYKINHLSIKDALFVYFQKDEFEELTAIHLEESFIKRTLKNETPFLKNLTDNDVKIYELFSSIYYFHGDNLLFKSLESMIKKIIHNKFLQKDIAILPLYFNYSRILFAQDMISSKILLKENFKITDLFEQEELSEQIKNFNLTILALYSNNKNMSIYEVKLLLALAILGQSNYFISKYLTQYNLEKYKKKYANLLENFLIEYNSLDSMDSKIYASMYSKLTNKKIDSTLSLYEEGGLILLYNNTISSNKYKCIMDVLVKNQLNNIKQRSFLEKQKRIYKTLKYSRDIGLKKHFYSTIYYYAKKKELLNPNIKELLNEISFDILLQDIEYILYSSDTYRYLDQDRKHKLNRFSQLEQIYRENSLNSLLISKNIDDFKYIVYFIKTEDIIRFLTFYIENSDKETLSLIAPIVSKEHKTDILVFCKNYLINKQSSSTILLFIYYKLKDIQKLEEMVILKEKKKKEYQFIVKIKNSINNDLLTVDPLMKSEKYKMNSRELISYLKRTMRANRLLFHELEFFTEDISSYDLKDFSYLLAQISFSIQDEVELKDFYSQYKDFLLKKDFQIVVLNIIRLNSFDMFMTSFKSSTNEFKIEYLFLLVMQYDRNIEILSDEIFYLIFDAISNSNYNKNVKELIRRVYTRIDCINFAKRNPILIEEAYLLINESLTKYALEIKVRIYKIFINLYSECEYFNLLDKGWISNELKSRMALNLIYKMKNKNAMQKLYMLCLNFDKPKALIHIGLTFNLENELKEATKLLYIFKNTRKNNVKYFENYLEFTVANNAYLNKNTFNFMKNIFISKHKSKSLLSMFLNVEEFIATNQFSENNIQFPNEFLKNHLFYSLDKNKISKDFFEDSDTLTLEKLAILYAQYKESEEKEDTENYDRFESIFSSLKSNSLKYLNNNFNDIETLSLDNMFSRIKNEDINLIEFLRTDYSKFYKSIQKIHDNSLSHDLEIKNKALNEFAVLKESIRTNEEYMVLLKEKSFINSKLSIKLENIDLFRPK